MGFIERARKEAEAQRKASIREGNAKISLKLADEEARRRISDLCNQSQAYLASSFFPEFCEELDRLGKGEKGSITKVEEDTDGMIRGSLYFSFVLDTKPFASGKSVSRVIEIEARPEGMIVIHGGMFGSTRLLPKEWQGNQDLQEKALEKGYKHPKHYLVDSMSEPPFDRDGA